MQHTYNFANHESKCYDASHNKFNTSLPTSIILYFNVAFTTYRGFDITRIGINRFGAANLYNAGRVPRGTTWDGTIAGGCCTCFDRNRFRILCCRRMVMTWSPRKTFPAVTVSTDASWWGWRWRASRMKVKLVFRLSCGMQKWLWRDFTKRRRHFICPRLGLASTDSWRRLHQRMNSTLEDELRESRNCIVD